MKKIILIIAICALCTQAQSQWSLTGNSGTNASTNFIGTKDNVSFKIRTNNSVRMTVTNGGKVGIGTAAPKTNLDVAGSIAGYDSYLGKTYPLSAGTSGSSYSSVGYGLTFTGTTANYLYRINNDYSSMISFRAGGFDFNTAPIGFAGNVISYTTAMTILQNGKVGIGTLSPANNLSVAGTADFERVNVSDLYVVSSNSVAGHFENTGNTNSSHGLLITAGSNTGNGAYFNLFYRPDGTLCGGVVQTNGNHVGYATTSDKRLKNIIGTSQKGLSDLMKIKIYDYTFKSDQDKQVLTGFIAQELYDVFPQSVRKPIDNNEPAEKNPWMVDYGSVTPLIIKSVQEQQQLIEKLQNENTTLKSRLDKLEMAFSQCCVNYQPSKDSPQPAVGSQQSSDDASLEQNQPNPFNEQTEIKFHLPAKFGSAQLVISDESGRPIRTYAVQSSTSLIMKAGELPSGMYSYSLIVDNITVDTKQMVLTK